MHNKTTGSYIVDIALDIVSVVRPIKALRIVMIFGLVGIPASHCYASGGAPSSVFVAPPEGQLRDFEQRKIQMRLLPKPVRGDAGSAVNGTTLGREVACHLIERIDLRDDAGLADRRVQAVRASYEHRCLGARDINALVKEVDGVFLGRGIITSRAYIPPQNIGKHRLTIALIPGLIEDVQVTGRPKRNIVRMAFPDWLGKILDLKTLEQGVENINRLSHMSARLRIEPGTRANASRVIVTVPRSSILHGQVWTDNYSQPVTGQQMGHIVVSAENPLGLLDLWSLEYDRSLQAGRRVGGSSLLMGNGAIPFGYWTVFGSFWSSSDNYPLQLPTVTLSVKGLRSDWTLGVSRVLTRNSLGVTTLQASFEQKTFGSRLAGEPIEVTRGRQAYVNAQVSESTRVWGALLYLTLSTKIAFDGAGTRSNFIAPAKTDPHTSFLRPALDVDLYKPLPTGVLWHAFLHGELSSRNQFAINQLQIGGPYTVRGSLQNILIGNNGLYLRNDLSWHLPFVISAKDFFSSLSYSLFENVEVYSALDFGITRAGFKVPSMSTLQKGGEILGGAVGVRKTSEPFFWDVSLTHSLYSRPLPSEGLVTLFQLGMKV